jgi:hypothetical protein
MNLPLIFLSVWPQASCLWRIFRSFRESPLAGSAVRLGRFFPAPGGEDGFSKVSSSIFGRLKSFLKGLREN